ncbi:MAG: FKBP-type peptidyl-prolyl cis-trans isomerase [Micromonosporaceae bacterium]|nr:FKBP-type peptidyl-prolyl cis-trans isomerase [Micromonosporaceae bacterium]
MGTPVKDRSGRGLPSKAERWALGKAAARKRAAAWRRRELLNRVMRVAGPVLVVGVIIGVVWLFSGGGTTPTPTSGAPTWLPAGLDPQLATKPEVTAGEGTVSELKVTTLIEGAGAPLEAGQTVSVNYVVVYYDTGTELDSSWKRNQPYEFTLGAGDVIQGWDQGLVGVPVGSRVQLDVPSDLAYRDGQALRFVVDILSAS